ncbi:hypothetical protein V501_03946 [Pseudogymnoascus sp. VKM F-4519 (FW-2642)]|nr:hypothetical protein V501_03946 [Pseudogymnoascus sp. VKM F-4519 (FW-2642)]
MYYNISKYVTMTFEDVHEDTFIRICQFAYTGDYETPVFIQRPEPGLPDKASSVLPAPNVDTNEPGEIAEELEPEGAEAEADDWSFSTKRPKNLKSHLKAVSYVTHLTRKSLTLKRPNWAPYIDVKSAKTLPPRRITRLGFKDTQFTQAP